MLPSVAYSRSPMRHAMKRPIRRAAAAAEAPKLTLAHAPKLAHAPMSDIIDALADGQITATALSHFDLARIEAYDRDGPMLNAVRARIEASRRDGSRLNAVRALNPDALTIAGKLDETRPSGKRAVAGVPILL